MSENQRSLRVLRAVFSELPFPPYSVAPPRIYGPSEVHVNPYGAVSVDTPGGQLGLKPDEFEWIDSLEVTE